MLLDDYVMTYTQSVNDEVPEGGIIPDGTEYWWYQDWVDNWALKFTSQTMDEWNCDNLKISSGGFGAPYVRAYGTWLCNID